MPNQQRENIYCSIFGVTNTPTPIATGSGLLSLVSNPTSVDGAVWIGDGSFPVSQPFGLASRRQRGLLKIGQSQHPAFYVRVAGEAYERTLIRGPAKVTFVTHVYIESISAEDPNVVSDTELNNLADLIESAVDGQYLFGGTTLNNQVLDNYIASRMIQYAASGAGKVALQVMEVHTICPQLLGASM